MIDFKVESRDQVDGIYQELTDAGSRGQRPLYDAFLGARCAVIEDSDGNPVGVMSPVDSDRRSDPDFA